MSLVQFFKSVCESTGLKVKDDNYIYINMFGEQVDSIVSDNDIPIVLPSKEHLDTIVITDDESNVIQTKIIFNPLAENALSDADSFTLTMLRSAMRIHIISQVHQLGLTVFETMTKNVVPVQISTKISDLSEALSTYTSKRSKEAMVTKTTLSKFGELMEAIIKTKGSKYVADIILGKNSLKEKTVKGEEYTRYAKFHSELIEDLERIKDLSSDDERNIFNVKLPKKTIYAIIELLKFMIPPLQDNTYMEVSDDPKAPGFHALMKLTLPITKRLNDFFLTFKDHLPEGVFDKFYKKEILTYEDIQNEILKNKVEILTLPKFTDIEKIQEKVKLEESEKEREEKEEAKASLISRRRKSDEEEDRRRDREEKDEPRRRYTRDTPSRRSRYEEEEEDDTDPLSKFLNEERPRNTRVRRRSSNSLTSAIASFS